MPVASRSLPRPQVVTIAEVHRVGILDHRVRTRHGVACRGELVEGKIHPVTFLRPICHGRFDLVAENVLGVDGVERQFHLVDRHTVGGEVERLVHRVAPAFVAVADHAGDQVDVDVLKSGCLNPRPGFKDFRRLVGAAVLAQDRVIEVLDAQAQSGDAQIAKRFDLRLAQRARFAFEGHFFRLIPTDIRPQSIDQSNQLLRAEERGRSAAKIDKSKWTTPHDRQLAHEFNFTRQGSQVAFHLGSVLVGEDFEVAELTAFATERNVQVQTERHVGWRLIERGRHFRQLIARPLRKRRVVADEVRANFSFRRFGRHALLRGLVLLAKAIQSAILVADDQFTILDRGGGEKGAACLVLPRFFAIVDGDGVQAATFGREIDQIVGDHRRGFHATADLERPQGFALSRIQRGDQLALIGKDDSIRLCGGRGADGLALFGIVVLPVDFHRLRVDGIKGSLLGAEEHIAADHHGGRPGLRVDVEPFGCFARVHIDRLESLIAASQQDLSFDDRRPTAEWSFDLITPEELRPISRPAPTVLPLRASAELCPRECWERHRIQRSLRIPRLARRQQHSSIGRSHCNR